MFKVSHTTLIVISGLIWLGVGCLLLSLGLNFLVASFLKDQTSAHPLLDLVAPYLGGVEQSALFLVVVGLLIGYLKCRYIFSKTVQKGVDRILQLPNPVSISQIYTKKYYILLGSMMVLGFLVKFVALDIRGTVDIIIGAALINGAMLYFRRAFYVYQENHRTAKPKLL